MTDDKVAVQQWQVSAEYAGQRIDNFLLTRLKGAPRSLIYRIIRSGEVRVNRGRIRAEYRLQAGDELRIPPLRLAAVENTPLQPGRGLAQALELRIIHEQDGLLVLNKPQGLAVHGGSGIQCGAIEALRQMRPHYAFLELVHRIDRDTSGLLLLAYKRQVLLEAQAALQRAETVKCYQAVLIGTLPQKRLRIEQPLYKYTLPSGEMRVRVDAAGKAARSDFVRQWQSHSLCGVEVRIHTGRTHQIRVHARSLGHPVLGDEKYGLEAENLQWQLKGRQKGWNRLFLHAGRLELAMPSGVLAFEVPADAGMQELWRQGMQGLLEV